MKTAFDDRLQKRDEPTEEYIGDEFLRAVLESSREQASMRNIISTIQKKQNEIIRQPRVRVFWFKDVQDLGKHKCFSTDWHISEMAASR